MANGAPKFTGSIPENYEQYLVPFLFQDYAAELAEELSPPGAGVVLELACGTGVLTRRLRSVLPDATRLVATDLNKTMLDVARTSLSGHAGVEFQIADGTNLPFTDQSFDAVYCQFGIMLFPGKQRGFCEAARVLKPGGKLAFSVWDSLDSNPLSMLVHETVIALSPEDPADFLARPHHYCDVPTITTELENAGFESIRLEKRRKQGRADSAEHIVMGLVAGGPLAAELEARNLTDRARARVADVLRQAHGAGAIEAPMQAIIGTASKPLQQSQ